MLFTIPCTGRVLNRFSKDIGFIDDMLPANFYSCTIVSISPNLRYMYMVCRKSEFFSLQLILTMITTAAMALAANYWIFLPTILSVCVLWVLRWYYLRTSRDLKRLEAVGRLT